MSLLPPPIHVSCLVLSQAAFSVPLIGFNSHLSHIPSVAGTVPLCYFNHTLHRMVIRGLGTMLASHRCAKWRSDECRILFRAPTARKRHSQDLDPSLNGLPDPAHPSLTVDRVAHLLSPSSLLSSPVPCCEAQSLTFWPLIRGTLPSRVLNRQRAWRHLPTATGSLEHRWSLAGLWSQQWQVYSSHHPKQRVTVTIMIYTYRASTLCQARFEVLYN